MHKASPYYIDIDSKSWEKDSHGLHDYDDNSKNREFKVTAQDSFVLGRKKNGNCFFSTSSSMNGMPLISVINIGERFFVDNCFPKQTTTWYEDFRNWNWIPTIAYENTSPFKNWHRLLIGDVIKFGRLVFEVKTTITLHKATFILLNSEYLEPYNSKNYRLEKRDQIHPK
jgi:hypothetical protein